MNPDVLASEIPELSAGVLYVYFLVKMVRAWLPGPLFVLEGSRVWVLVFGASLLVTWLLAGHEQEFTKELVVQALALTITAVGADNIGSKLDGERASRVSRENSGSRLP